MSGRNGSLCAALLTEHLVHVFASEAAACDRLLGSSQRSVGLVSDIDTSPQLLGNILRRTYFVTKVESASVS